MNALPFSSSEKGYKNCQICISRYDALGQIVVFSPQIQALTHRNKGIFQLIFRANIQIFELSSGEQNRILGQKWASAPVCTHMRRLKILVSTWWAGALNFLHSSTSLWSISGGFQILASFSLCITSFRSKSMSMVPIKKHDKISQK